MNNKTDFKNIIPILESSDVKFAGVFGSSARDEAKEDSDVDILVAFRKPKSLLRIIALERELEAILSRKVDLVTEQSLSPYIKDEISRDLKPIYGTR